MSIPLLNEGVSILKVFAVFISISGVIVIVSFGSSQESGNITPTWYGYVLLFVSLSFYCSQEVGFKVLVNKAGEICLSPEERVLLTGARSRSRRSVDDRIRSKSEDEVVPTLGIHQNEDDYLEEIEIAEKANEESNIGKFMYSAMFLGIVGVCNACFVIWLVLIWNYVGWEEFVWPDHDQTQLLLLNMSLGLVLILSIFVATAFTTPLVVSVGSLLVMPFSMMFDYFLHSSVPYVGEWVGVVLITSGFASIFLAREYNRKYATKQGQKGFLDTFLFLIFHEKHFFTKTQTAELEWYEEKRSQF